jgi:hypothetical protein
MFRDLPSQGVVDFLFADLTPDVIILRPHEFETNVHAGVLVGWLHRTDLISQITMLVASYADCPSQAHSQIGFSRYCLVVVQRFGFIQQ